MHKLTAPLGKWRTSLIAGQTFATPSFCLHPKTSSLRLTIDRPTTGGDVTWDGEIEITLRIRCNGELFECKTSDTGGIVVLPPHHRIRYESEREQSELIWTPPWGFFGARSGFPRRMGEGSTQFCVEAIITCASGTITTTVHLEHEIADAPQTPFHSSVSYDTQSSSIANTSGTSISTSHTASGSNRAAFMCAEAEYTLTAPTNFAITYAGNASSALWTVAGGYYNVATQFARYALDASLSTGSQTVAASWTAGGGTIYVRSIMCVTLAGVDQTTPVGTAVTTYAATGTTPTVTVTRTSETGMVVDALNAWVQTGTPSAGANQDGRIAASTSSGGVPVWALASTQSLADGGVMTWTKNSNYEYIYGAVAFNPAYTAGDLETDLVSVWELDESSGNAIDSYDGHDATDTNTVGASATAPSALGGSRDFERDNSEYFTIADHADLSGGDVSWTVTGWVRLESAGTIQTMVSKHDGSTIAGSEFALFYNSVTFRGSLYLGSSTDTQVTWGSTPSLGTWYFFAMWYDAVADTFNLSVNNGTPVSASHSGGSNDTTVPFQIGATNGSNCLDGMAAQVAFWRGRILSPAERTALYAGGNGLPYDDWGISGGGPTEVALTGVSATGALGTLTPVLSIGISGEEATGATGSITAAQSLTGEEATGDLGTLTATLTLAITGVQATGALGTLGPVNTIALSGLEATGETGDLTASQSLTGEEATGAEGDLGVSLTVALTGIAATSALGSLTPDHSLALTGENATTALGALAPEFAVPLVGEEATGELGDLTAAQSLTGVEATGALGTLTPTLSIALTGEEATGALGTLTANFAVPLAGEDATGETGTLTPTVPGEVSLAGVQATGVLGTLGVTLTMALSGEEATGAEGDLAPVLTIGLGGLEAAGETGTLGLTAGGSIELTGVVATGEVGTLTTTGPVSEELSGVSAQGQVGNLTVVLGGAGIGGGGTLPWYPSHLGIPVEPERKKKKDEREAFEQPVEFTDEDLALVAAALNEWMQPY